MTKSKARGDLNSDLAIPPGETLSDEIASRGMSHTELAVVNAVAHRDYAMHGSRIRLHMFADRIELYSPGALANTLTVEDLAYRQASRNETLASLLAGCPVPSGIAGLETSRTTLMDRRGQGVPIILARSTQLSGKRPEYRLFGDELRLTIYAAHAGTSA